MPGQLNKTLEHLLLTAKQQYPILSNQDIAYKYTPSNDDRMLEFYPKGERDSFDKSRPAVQIFNKNTAPKDIAGDVTSHLLVNNEPVVQGAYNNFKNSLQPWQKQKLKEQYQYSVKNFGEKRPYEKWEEVSGLPAYFRGHLFQQWPKSESMYTPQQLESFGQLNQYLTGPNISTPIQQLLKVLSSTKK